MQFKNVIRATLWLLSAPLCVAHADELSGLYEMLQAHPRDVALNLKYAAAAERAGKMKWALPAYERALGAAPGNEEARQGIERVQTQLRAKANDHSMRNDSP